MPLFPSLNRLSILSAALAIAAAAFAAPPPTPTGIDASDNTYPRSVGIAWEHVREATLYRIFRSDVNNPATATEIGSSVSITFSDIDVPKDQGFFYWVQAENSAGETSPLGGPDIGSRPGRFDEIPRPELPQISIPANNPVTAAKVYLGKTLFWDEQLSSTRTTSCGTCHFFSTGGADSRTPVHAASTNPGFDGVFGTPDDTRGSRGVPRNLADGTYEWDPQFGLDAQVTPRKVPSMVNAAFATNGILWDGKGGSAFRDPITDEMIFPNDASLEAQALLPLLNPVEMAHQGRTIQDVVARITESLPLALAAEVPAALGRWIGSRSYADLFAEAFGSPGITPARIAMAISSYERTLISDRTPFDVTTAGGPQASADQQAGFDIFQRASCSFCHALPLTSDRIFQNTGIRPPEEDLGRGGITGADQDMGLFRTPSLRNVALRGPLNHTGRFDNLEQVIEFYNRGGDFDSPNKSPIVRQLGLTSEEKALLVNFIRTTLTDPRVASESAPLFDRPMLYSESGRVPRLTGFGTQNADGTVPQVIAVEPPFAGNPNFTVGVTEVPAGATVELVIFSGGDRLGGAVFFQGETIAHDAGQGVGYASLTLPIPDDASIIGNHFIGHWNIISGATVSTSPDFEFTVFRARTGTTFQPAKPFSSFSAASLTHGMVAPGSIVSGFGADLATAVKTASAPLPDQLDGLRVIVTDANGVQHTALLYFVAPGQINYLVPRTAAMGEATVRVMRGETEVARGTLNIARFAPTLFAANSDGKDTAAALMLHFDAASNQTVEQVAEWNDEHNRFLSKPLAMGADADQLFLSLYGTGIRGVTKDLISATIGGLNAEVLFSGPQGEFDGLDQVNLRVPRELAGHREVDVILIVNGVRANPVRVNFQ